MFKQRPPFFIGSEYAVVEIILTILIIIFSILAYYLGKRAKITKEYIDNEPLRQEKQKLEIEVKDLNKEIKDLDNKEENLKNKLQEEEEKFVRAKQSHRDMLDEDITLIGKWINEDQLKADARLAEIEDELHQTEFNAGIQKTFIKSELDSLKATRKAAIEALKKEAELQKKPEDFCIPFSAQELHDINLLNDLRAQLNYPTALGKVIWSVFIQKKMNNFCAARLHTSDKVCGIYKITNILTQECYIGQSVNIKDRFIEHIKAGVGATEASVTNKLYQAIQKYGIQNFAFELIESCSSSELNNKEKYFISLYQSDTSGYNITKGNK